MEIKHTVSAGGVVLNNNKVLVVNQNHDSWSLPKGHSEPNESLVQTAIREIGEESGIKDLTLVKELGSYQRQRINDPSEIKTIYMYLFTTNQTELNPTDSSIPESKWVEIADVSKTLTAKEDKDFFNSVDLETVTSKL